MKQRVTFLSPFMDGWPYLAVMAHDKSIYVETHIRSSMDALWERTQAPEQHVKWDLRFSTIEYLPKSEPDAAQRFRYSTNIGFGLRIEGQGESTATRKIANGGAVSSLTFWSDQARSLIKRGSGYWSYEPSGNGVAFKTWYDYAVRYDVFGRVLDLAFRPLIGWATAFSFDVLRLWLEKGLAPQLSRARYLTVLLANMVLGFSWIYQGLVPKLLRPDTGEVALLLAAGVPPGATPLLLAAIGVAEMLFGVAFWFRLRCRLLHALNLLCLPLLALAAAVNSPETFVAPFNPATLTITMMALSIIALANMRDLPDAANCLRSPKHDIDLSTRASRKV